MAFANTLYELYSANDGPPTQPDYLALVKLLRLGREKLLKGPYQDALFRIKTFIIPVLAQLTSVFKTPVIVMKKRESKSLDYQRYKELTSQGRNDIEDSLKESADAFLSINAQLIDELPMLTKLSQEYMAHVVAEIASIQQQFYTDSRDWLHSIYEKIGDPIGLGGCDDICAQFLQQMQIGGIIEKTTSKITVLNEWNESIWGVGFDERRSIDTSGVLIDLSGPASDSASGPGTNF